MDQTWTPDQIEVRIPEGVEYRPLSLGPAAAAVKYTFGFPERCTITFALDGGRLSPASAKVQFDFLFTGGRYVLTRLEATGPPGGSLELEQVRRFRINLDGGSAMTGAAKMVILRGHLAEIVTAEAN